MIKTNIQHCENCSSICGIQANQKPNSSTTNKQVEKDDRIYFTKQMKKDYTILIPNMLPVHFNIVAQIFLNEGYNVKLLTNDGPDIVTQGLKYVHNDTCYPALLVIGQMISALNSGEYDVHKTALIITQTGGGCRASNYIHLLRKALKKSGYGYVPVISLNMSGLESNPGFQVNFRMLRKGIAALVSGDVIMQVANQTRPYEVKKGETDDLIAKWSNSLTVQFNSGQGYKMKQLKANLKAIIKDFSFIKIKQEKKVKVGIVGEIYVKYSPFANNHLESFLAEQNCEVCVPGIMAFMLFKVDNRIEDINLYGGSFIKYQAVNILKKFLTRMENYMIDSYKEFPMFIPPTSFDKVKALVNGVVGYGSKMGEGWLLTAEMLELAENGYENIVCAQPFGCLPNHICGKGMIRKVREINPKANIVAVDYDPGATKVNQENRIKLMLAVAKENMDIQNNHAKKPSLQMPSESNDKEKVNSQTK